jgi:hypothetical protein
LEAHSVLDALFDQAREHVTRVHIDRAERDQLLAVKAGLLLVDLVNQVGQLLDLQYIRGYIKWVTTKGLQQRGYSKGRGYCRMM